MLREITPAVARRRRIMIGVAGAIVLILAVDVPRRLAAIIPVIGHQFAALAIGDPVVPHGCRNSVCRSVSALVLHGERSPLFEILFGLGVEVRGIEAEQVVEEVKIREHR